MNGSVQWNDVPGQRAVSCDGREALAKRKAEGKPLGRLKGRQATRLKLDAQEVEMHTYLANGISTRAIAKLVDCAPSTL